MCLASPTAQATPPIKIPSPETIDLSCVPPEYHNLKDVLSKAKSLLQPPHRPYDCAIDLLPGAPLLISKLYNLSRPERAAIEAYGISLIPWHLVSLDLSPHPLGTVSFL